MVQTTNQFYGGGPQKKVSTHRAVVQQLRLLTLVPPDRFHRRRPGRIWGMRPIQQNPKPNLWITIVTKPLYVYHLSMCIYIHVYTYINIINIHQSFRIAVSCLSFSRWCASPAPSKPVRFAKATPRGPWREQSHLPATSAPCLVTKWI